MQAQEEHGNSAQEALQSKFKPRPQNSEADGLNTLSMKASVKSISFAEVKNTRTDSFVLKLLQSVPSMSNIMPRMCNIYKGTNANLQHLLKLKQHKQGTKFMEFTARMHTCAHLHYSKLSAYTPGIMRIGMT